jgi:ribosomal protein S27E
VHEDWDLCKGVGRTDLRLSQWRLNKKRPIEGAKRPMPFQIMCPQQHLLEVHEAQVGQQVQCPMCGQLLIVPMPDTVTIGAELIEETRFESKNKSVGIAPQSIWWPLHSDR